MLFLFIDMPQESLCLYTDFYFYILYFLAHPSTYTMSIRWLATVKLFR